MSVGSWRTGATARSVSAAGDDDLARVVAIRQAILAISSEYLLWLDGEGEEPEPVLPATLQPVVSGLVAQLEALLGGHREPPGSASRRA